MNKPSSLDIILEVLPTLTEDEMKHLVKMLINEGVNVCSLAGHKYKKVKESKGLISTTTVLVCEKCGKVVYA